MAATTSVFRLPEGYLKAPDLPVHVVNLVHVEIRQRHGPDAHPRKIDRKLPTSAADPSNDHMTLPECCKRLVW